MFVKKKFPIKFLGKRYWLNTYGYQICTIVTGLESCTDLKKSPSSRIGHPSEKQSDVLSETE